MAPDLLRVRQLPVQYRSTTDRTHYASAFTPGVSVCGLATYRPTALYRGNTTHRFRSPQLVTCRACLRSAKARPKLILTEETITA